MKYLSLAAILILVMGHAVAEPTPDDRSLGGSVVSAPQDSPSTNQDQSRTKTAATSVSLAKDLVQIVFFVIVGTIGILSYIQARKTLFTPIRTETFKLQLKAFEDVLLFFEKHEESDITNAFDYQSILGLNAIELYDAYAFQFFSDGLDIEAIRKSREEREERPYGALVTQDFMEEHFEISNEHITRDKKDGLPYEDTKNPAVILARWQKYQHGMIHYSKKFHEAQEAVRRFQISPVLPRGLKDLLKSFDQLTAKNLTILGEVLTEAAREMPDKYPSVESLTYSKDAQQKP